MFFAVLTRKTLWRLAGVARFTWGRGITGGYEITEQRPNSYSISQAGKVSRCP